MLDYRRRKSVYDRAAWGLYWGCNRRNDAAPHLNCRVRLARLIFSPMLMVVVCFLSM